MKLLVTCFTTLLWCQIVILGNLVMATTAVAEEIVIVSEEWPRATDKDGKGLYWDIMRAVYEQSGTKLTFQNMSYARSIKKIAQKNADIMLGAALDEIEGGLYPEFALDIDHLYVIHKKTTPWQDEHSLQGKKVGWIKDYGYENELSVTVALEEFLSLNVGLKRLLRNELDYVIDAKLDLETAITENQLNADDFVMSTLSSSKTFPVFANNEKGQALMARYNSKMTELLANGTIKSLFEKYSWPTYPH